MPTVYTIGFTRKSLEQFIGLLKTAGVESVIDIRLRNTSQLAGWSKYPDFAFLLRAGFGIGYEHRPEFSPTGELLHRYKKDRYWSRFERDFKRLLRSRDSRKAATSLIRIQPVCLLCTEPEPDRCHRRLVAEYIANVGGSKVSIEHL